MAMDRLMRRVSTFFEKRGARHNMNQIVRNLYPTNRTFAVSRDAARAIEGMFSEFSMAIIDCPLSLQTVEKISGHILEMGVYRGRSAALLGRWLAPSKRLVLVDIKDHLDRKAIEPFRDAVDYIVQSTAMFKESAAAPYKHAFRFIHIDASHEYRATFAELEMADGMLASRGIIALDDFANLNYSQNIAAIFKYLYTTGADLRIFLATSEKAYLCSSEDLPFYSAFIMNRLIPEMVSRDMKDICLARTDFDPEYSAFHARARNVGEEGFFYGADIYGKFFINP